MNKRSELDALRLAHSGLQLQLSEEQSKRLEALGYVTDAQGTIAVLRSELAAVTAKREWLSIAHEATYRAHETEQRAHAETLKALEESRQNLREYDDLVGDMDPPDILVHWLEDRRLLASARASEAALRERVKEACEALRPMAGDCFVKEALRALTVEPTGQEGERG